MAMWDQGTDSSHDSPCEWSFSLHCGCSHRITATAISNRSSLSLPYRPCIIMSFLLLSLLALVLALPISTADVTVTVNWTRSYFISKHHSHPADGPQPSRHTRISHP